MIMELGSGAVTACATLQLGSRMPYAGCGVLTAPYVERLQLDDGGTVALSWWRCPHQTSRTDVAVVFPGLNNSSETGFVRSLLAQLDGAGFWHDCRNQHSSADAAMMELLDNVADEHPTRCAIEVRARAGTATCVALRNDVRDRAASVLDALSLMRSEKRGPGALIGENGVGLKAAAAKLGGGAVVLTARRAAQSFVIRRGARRETVGEGATFALYGVATAAALGFVYVAVPETASIALNMPSTTP